MTVLVLSSPVSGVFYDLKNMKIRMMGTYLRFGIVALFFGIVGLSPYMHIDVCLLILISGSRLDVPIGIVGTSEKKSELWEHIFI
jgi:uncharacterized membrane protein